MQVNRWFSLQRLAVAMVTLLNTGGFSVQAAPAPTKLVLDDFENGVGAWTRNDKIKTDNPAADVLLVDIAPSRPASSVVPGSKGAGLFAFKAAQNSWASASLRVDGARWAQIGAQRLTFWLNAGGEQLGVGLVLRGRYQGADGTPHEEVFELPVDLKTKLPAPVKLTVKHWRKVVIPLTDFHSARGPLPPRLSGVYLLQFVQRGSWNSRFFTVDQMEVEGNGIPIPQVTAATPTQPTQTGNNTPDDTGAVAVNVDYLRFLGKVRPSANVSIGATLPGGSGTSEFPLAQSDQFRRALQTLTPRFVRLDAGGLVELIDSSRPGFDFSRLVNAVTQVRALGSEPFVALPNPTAWGLDGRAYAQFAVQAARAVNARSQAVRYFELPTALDATDDASAVALYNGARTALKALSPKYLVGGITASSGRANTLAALLKGTMGLDFLSVQYYGAWAGEPSVASLYGMARDVKTLHEAGAALDHSRWRNIPIFVTQSNLNAARSDGGEATDSRITQMVSAAWWLTFMSNASRISDQIFQNDAGNPEWGLLDESSRAYPAYYVLWMWNSFVPAGSQRVEVRVSRGDIVAVAANTATAHNLLLANTTDRDQTAKIAIRGFPVLRSARTRILEDPQKGVRFEDLPKSPFQTITLKPYAVAVLQFIEPPKTR
ncbi:MAG: hypothetical protein JO316_23545 [Abitibacteriaceae bacterium]|nr:hypothetical protein [Abditibacteriaceae bacterium]